MVQADHGAVAQALAQARRSGRPCDAAPFADSLQEPDAAYAVQALVAHEMHFTSGAGAWAWKSGGPSREAVLTHAALPPGGLMTSPADARDRRFNIRLIEAEIALRLGRDVTPEQAAHLPYSTAAALVDAMAVSIEIVDSRWQQGVNAPALLKLADLQSHGALVLGAWQPFVARDWSAQTCSVRIGTAAEAAFRGTHSLQDPAWLLPQWLRHATRAGEAVLAGTVVTTGTWCGMLPAAAGDLVRVRFDAVGEASVQL